MCVCVCVFLFESCSVNVNSSVLNGLCCFQVNLRNGKKNHPVSSHTPSLSATNCTNGLYLLVYVSAANCSHLQGATNVKTRTSAVNVVTYKW